MSQFLKNLNYETWVKNHEPNHNDKWFRELYPYHLFQKIDFNLKKVNHLQILEVNKVKYGVTIQKVELQENGRYRTTFDVSTHYPSQYLSWNVRSWNSTFQIVYSANFDFVTVFTKKEDPSKDYIERFMKGSFEKISKNKSLPLSELLFRTLLLELSEKTYADGKYKATYEYLVNGVRQVPAHPQFKRKARKHTPLYSIGRQQWVCYSFMEEKAHRLAFNIANQCENLVIVFCNPTYTPHHRCKYDGVKVVSLYEYSSLISSSAYKEFGAQIRFLQHHLNIAEPQNVDKLKFEIQNPKEGWYEIKKRELLEAISVMKIKPLSLNDIFYSLSALNLINAYLSQQGKIPDLTQKEYRNYKRMYLFKTYLSNLLGDLISRNVDNVKIYINKDLVIVEVHNFQFSFHSFPKPQLLVEYELSSRNIEMKWSGIRLQPIAPLIFNYAQALR